MTEARGRMMDRRRGGGWKAGLAVIAAGVVVTAQAGVPVGGIDSSPPARVIGVIPLWFPPSAMSSVENIRMNGTWEPGLPPPLAAEPGLERYDLRMFTRSAGGEETLDRIVRTSGRWWPMVSLMMAVLAVVAIAKMLLEARPPSGDMPSAKVLPGEPGGLSRAGA